MGPDPMQVLRILAPDLVRERRHCRKRRNNPFWGGGAVLGEPEMFPEGRNPPSVSPERRVGVHAADGPKGGLFQAKRGELA